MVFHKIPNSDLIMIPLDSLVCFISFRNRGLFFVGLLFLTIFLGTACFSIHTLVEEPSLEQVEPSKLVKYFNKGNTYRPGSEVEVLVYENRNLNPVEGAVVLLSGQIDQGSNYGRVTSQHGLCHFQTTAGTYTVSVQFTGYKQFQQRDFVFQSGNAYRLEIELAQVAEDEFKPVLPVRQTITAGSVVAKEAKN